MMSLKELTVCVLIYFCCITSVEGQWFNCPFIKASDATQYIESHSWYGIKNYYSLSNRCWWIETEDTSGSTVVELSVDSFELQPSSGCFYDRLNVFDSYFEYGKYLKYCGTNIKTTYSSGRYMFLRFKTDAMNNYGGFKLGIKQVSKSKYDPKQWVYSYNYGTTSYPGFKFTWTPPTRSGSHITTRTTRSYPFWTRRSYPFWTTRSNPSWTTTPTSINFDIDDYGSFDSLSSGEIIGLAIGVAFGFIFLVILALLVGLVCYIVRKKNRQIQYVARSIPSNGAIYSPQNPGYFVPQLQENINQAYPVNGQPPPYSVIPNVGMVNNTDQNLSASHINEGINTK